MSVHDTQVTADNIATAMGGSNSAAGSGSLQALRVPRPVERSDNTREQCRGLRVLDVGAYDETWWSSGSLPPTALGLVVEGTTNPPPGRPTPPAHAPRLRSR